MFAVSGLFSPAKQIAVPNLLGLEQEAAVESLKNEKLQVGNVDAAYSDTYPEGQVCETFPSAGKKVDEDSKVDITISKGPKPADKTQVPDLSAAKDEADARKMITKAGLKTGNVQQRRRRRGGHHHRAEPCSRRAGRRGSIVDFVTSTGPDSVSVPDLTGLTESGARDALESAGFGMSVESESLRCGQGLRHQLEPQRQAGRRHHDHRRRLRRARTPMNDKVDVDALGLTGMIAENAQDAISNAELRYNPVPTASDTVEEGRVDQVQPERQAGQGHDDYRFCTFHRSVDRRGKHLRVAAGTPERPPRKACRRKNRVPTTCRHPVFVYSSYWPRHPPWRTQARWEPRRRRDAEACGA